MAHQVKVLAAQPDDLRLFPEPHIKVEGDIGKIVL